MLISGQLFVAAMGPALLAIVFYMSAVAIYVRTVPGAAPAAQSRTDWAEVRRALERAWGVLALFAVVLGGIYTGVCTETEAAAIGAGGAFVFALARGRLNRQALLQAMSDTTATTAMIYLIIFGVLIFSFSLGVTGLPERIGEFFRGLDWAPVAIIALLLVVYLLLGCLMDSFTVMFLTTPLVAPLIVGLGYDLVWWGVVMLIVLETGLITPPFGIHLFVLKSTGAEVPLSTVYRGVAPFVATDFVKLALVVMFPVLALWLPARMIGS